jgi:hypothetical protein
MEDQVLRAYVCRRRPRVAKIDAKALDRARMAEGHRFG